MSLIDRIVRIVFKGEDQASDVAQGLWQRLKSLRWADIAGAFYVVKNAVGAVTGAMADLFASADALDNSLRKLEGTSRITGTPLDELQRIAAHAKREFGLGTVNANEYSIAVANLATKSGFAGDKQALLAAMLDLGAAKGLTAAETLQRIQQATLGVDEGTDALFGKNPSGLWADYAEQIGKSPGKMNDLDKSLVLVMATMDAGAKTVGSYAEKLNTAQGRQDQLNERVTEAKASLGVALSPLREFGIELLTALAGNAGEATGTVRMLATAAADLFRALYPLIALVVKIADVLVSGFAFAVRFVMLDIRRFATETTSRFGQVAVAIGGFVERSGALLKRFGIEVVAETGQSIREWGETQRDTSENALLGIRAEMQNFERDAKALGDRLFRGVRTAAEADIPPTTAALRDMGVTGASALTTVRDGAAQAGASIRAHLGPTVQDLLGVTEQSLQDLATTATMTLEPRRAEQFAGAMDVLRGKVAESRDRLQEWNPALKDADETAGNMLDGVGKIARAGIDAAQVFGVMDEKAAATLNSVVSLAENLSKAIGGDPTAIAASVLALANLLGSVFGGDAERQRLLRHNTEALQRLSRDVGGLKLNITGADFVKAQQALSGVVGQLAGGRGALNETDVRNALFGVGLTMADLEKIGKEFGIELRTKSGALNVDSVRAILEALNLTDLGRLGQGFGDRLDFFRDTQRVTGTAGTAGGLQGFIDYLRQVGGVSALDGFDITSPGARQRFVDLLVSLDNGEGVSAGALGQLTGEQFKDIILEIIDGIDALADDAAPPPAATPPATGIDGVDVAPGAPPAPAVTLADIFRGYAGEALPLLTDQLDAQRRIAAATETTAANTALTVSELRALRAYFSSGGLTARVNEELARAQDLESLAQGGGVAL